MIASGHFLPEEAPEEAVRRNTDLEFFVARRPSPSAFLNSLCHKQTFRSYQLTVFYFSDGRPRFVSFFQRYPSN